MSLQKNIIRVFWANILSIISGIVTSFIIPMVLSIESYSQYKTYTFYVSYVLILSLGFADGINYKYAGENEENIDKQILKNEHYFYMITQVIITIIIFIIALYNKNIIMILLALSIIPINLSWFYKFYYQAVGNFKEYSKISYTYTIITTVINIILVVFLKNNTYIDYCLSILISHTVVLIISEIKFKRNMKGIKSRLDKKVLENNRIGIFILLGNLSTMLFYALDRWFIKLFFSVNDFAYYSFAISIMSVINLLINAISVTFYNYLAKNKIEDKIREVKRYLIIIGAFASLSYFAFAAIINLILPKYIPSLEIISISFASYPYMIIINTLYVNLYKTMKREKVYFKVVIKMIILSIIYNMLMLSFWQKPEGIAMATTISFITWFIYSQRDFKFMKSTYSETLYLGIITISFILCSKNLNWLYGGISYFIILIVITTIVYKKDIIKIIKIIY